MKKLCYLLSLFVLMLSISCTKDRATNESVLNLGIIAQVKGLDPIYANDLYANVEVSRVYEGLLEYAYLKRPYTLEPNLAESMPEVSADGLTYTFKIRQGVMFQDDKAFPNGKGRELVAQDFVYSIKRLADPKLQGLGFWLIDGKIVGLNEWRDKNAELPQVNYDEEVEGLKALDKYTLQFKLTRPFPQILYALAMSFTFAVPKEAVEYYGKEFLNHPVGTGPYVLPKFEQGNNKIIYTKNPNYREKLYPSEADPELVEKGYLKDAGKRLPLIDKVVVNVIIEDQPRWLNFQKGNLDYIASIPKDNFASAIDANNQLTGDLKTKGIVLSPSPALDITYTGFNHEVKLFQNVKLRRAMMLAYDVNKSNELFYSNTGIPAQSVVPPGIRGHVEGYKNQYRGFGRPEDIKRAKELLAEAGYPDGKGLPEIAYDCPSSTVNRQIAEFFKTQMAQIGINIKISSSPWPEFQQKINQRKVMLFGIAWSADYPDAENFLQLLYGPNKTPGSNSSNYDNPEFNEIFKKASLMQDTPERTALYEQLYKMAAEEVPLIYSVHRQPYALLQGWFKNYMYSEFEGGREKYLNIDFELKKELLKKM